MFKQKIQNGYQIEVPDNWLKNGYPFELRRPEYAKEVHFGGYVRVEYDPEKGGSKFIHEGYQAVKAIPYDMPITGYDNDVVNTLRIWDAEPIVDFELDSFDKGDYKKAVEQENLARNIVEVLYPNDNHYAGKELRLKQQYFFVSASLQAAIAKYKKKHGDIHKLYEKVTFQMNDTHPTVAVAELMRILMDEEGLGWDEAWEVTTKSVAYTNHTIMSEALEKWPIELFSRLLPRVYQIIEEINRRFILEIQAKYPGNYEKIKKMAIIYDGQVKMAHLAIAAGYSVNGVARLHTEILKNQELKDFYEMMPKKFNNKTNGITQRRFLLHANPLLADWITEHIGPDWVTDLPQLKKLAVYADDEKALQEFMNIKYQNKVRLAEYIKKHNFTLTTGFIGTPYLNLVLSDNGYDDVAYKLFEQTAYPSWLYPVLQGATTIWERWNSYTLVNGFGPVDMNSFNHYSYGAIEEWMIAYTLGIQRDEEQPAYKHIILQPRIGGTFSIIRGHYDSAYGRIESGWQIQKKGYIYEATIPANTTTT